MQDLTTLIVPAPVRSEEDKRGHERIVATSGGWLTHANVAELSHVDIPGFRLRQPATRATSGPGHARDGALRTLACSAGAHLDSTRLLLWCPRQTQREHTLFQLGLNAGRVDLLRQLELPEEVR